MENEVFLQWIKGQETNLEIIDESDKLGLPFNQNGALFS